MSTDLDVRANSGQGPPGKPGGAARKPLPPWLALLCKVAALALLVFLTLTFVMGIHVHEGNRMYPFLMDGDLLITYKLEAYQVGDVVAYRHPETGKTEISRIVAMGDGVIQVTAYGELLINGVAPAERVFYPTAPLDGENVEYPYTMRRGGYFVLDDYRTEGDDSRRFGQLLEEDLLGKVVYVFRRRGI
ncbi:MAG: signal peptidase I [Clostridia bacterium]|nr:signal peptidase I [Clostridia bacterium]